ncbi:MAG: transglycosylase SLT domain-containing protein [Alicyclobacillaceae bacterium]|nr:transglycosylase SLT domain-containing protein [Alicyclobacillaceae bacterium]
MEGSAFWKQLFERLVQKPDESPEEAAKAATKVMVKAAVRKKIIGVLLSNAWWIIPAILIAYFLFFVVAAGIENTSFAVPWSDVANYPGIESGVPTPYQGFLTNASLAYHVPEQFLAAEAFTESDWDPAAYADYDGSHAMGLMQFEPGTWSGGGDPDQTLSEPDTDALRIHRYGGMGVDADGLTAPRGTSAFVAVHPKELLKLSESCGTSGACVSYASPFDPADALMAGAKYLSYLRAQSGNWVGAAEGYYGGSGAQSYAQKVVAVTYAYLKDFIPPAEVNGEYRLFGTFPATRIGHRIEVLPPSMPSSKARKSVFLETAYQKAVRAETWSASVPLFVPTSGVVRLEKRKGKWFVFLPTGRILIIPKADWMPWQVNEGVREQRMRAGDVVGFVDLASSKVLEN